MANQYIEWHTLNVHAWSSLAGHKTEVVNLIRVQKKNQGASSIFAKSIIYLHTAPRVANWCKNVIGWSATNESAMHFWGPRTKKRGWRPQVTAWQNFWSGMKVGVGSLQIPTFVGRLYFIIVSKTCKTKLDCQVFLKYELTCFSEKGCFESLLKDNWFLRKIYR